MKFDKNVMQKVVNLFCIADTHKNLNENKKAEFYMTNARNLLRYEYKKFVDNEARKIIKNS